MLTMRQIFEKLMRVSKTTVSIKVNFEGTPPNIVGAPGG